MTEPALTVFISYAHENEAWKDRLLRHLRVLELEGDLDVWEDCEINAGDDWQRRIEAAIDRARVAVLLISADFLISDFIRGEEMPRILARRASEGLRVIPLIVHPCPWLAVDWLAAMQARPGDGRALSAGSEHQIETDLSELALEIRELLADAPEPSPPSLTPSPTPTPKPPKRPRTALLGWLMLPTLAAGLLTLAASLRHSPTHVEVDLTTRRIDFTVGGTEPRKVLNVSVPFVSMVIERCEALTFVPAELAVAEGADGEPGWRLELNDRAAQLTCRDPDAQLTLRQPDPAAGDEAGRFESIWADAGSRFILGVAAGRRIDGARELEITTDLDRARSMTIAVESGIDIDVELADLEGVVLPPDGDYLTYRARFAEPDTWLDLRFQDGMTVVFVPPAGKANDLFVSSPIPVAAVELLYESLEGKLESPLLSEARLSYPEFPELPAVTIPADELLGIGELGTAQLKGLALDAEAGGLRLTFDGVAGKARSTDRAFSRDYRLTVWDRFAHGKLWNRLAAVAIWVLSTALVGLERWRTLS